MYPEPTAHPRDHLGFTENFGEPHFVFILLLISGCAGSSVLRGLFSSCSGRRLLSSCGVWGSHRGGFLYCGARAAGSAAFSNCNSQALWHRLIVAEHRLSAPWHVGSSWTRDQTRLLHWQADSLPLSHQGSPWKFSFMIHCSIDFD